MSLTEKIAQAKSVIRRTASRWPNDQVFIAWTGGKDSTLILHLVREEFGDKIPFRVLFNDSTIEFPEIYDFINQLKTDWDLDLVWLKHYENDLTRYCQATSKAEQMEIMRAAKINAINYAVKKYQVKAFISGIRKDEQAARSDETYFSNRESHTRVHPILNFTLRDVWRYIKKFNVPYVNLYDQGYKSLGEAPFTQPVKNPNDPERAGRDATKERVMARLRSLGYW